MTQTDTPPLIEALRGSATRFETAGGIVWHRWGSGPRELVLLHGGSGSWMHWAHNIEFFARHFRVWVPDLPGMGESALPPDPWTIPGLAQMLGHGLDEQADAAGTSIALAGFSFGAMVAVHWAALRPDRIRRVVTCATAGLALAHPPKADMRSWRGVSDARQRRELHRHNLRAWMLHDPRQADDLAAWIAQYSVERDRLRNRAISNSDTTLRTLPLVRCPVDVIMGCEDMLYRQARPQVESALRSAGVATFHWVQEAGHWLPFEQPQTFNALAYSLLAG